MPLFFFTSTLSGNHPGLRRQSPAVNTQQTWTNDTGILGTSKNLSEDTRCTRQKLLGPQCLFLVVTPL